jgi:large subunit ribosomal protein L22
MDVKSTYKYARISARKARDVAREIQGLPVSDALDVLAFTPRKGAELFNKTMKTALADAENNFELAVEGLYVKSAVVGEGPTFKRFKPRARGSASAIRKRTSHLTVILSDDPSGSSAPEAKAKTKSKPKAETKSQPASAAVAAAPKAEAKAAEEKGGEKTLADARALDYDLGVVYDSAPPEVDDLKEINGVGPVLEEKLHSFGIYTFKQIADWNEENIAAFDELLDFKGRIERDEWVAKAKDLHEEKHGA